MRLSPLPLGLLLIVAACPGDGPTAPSVASVQMSATSLNPRVEETSTVTATPVTSTGVPVTGVACAFSSSAAGIAAVDAVSGVVTGVSVGVATITATCGGATGTLVITVRPALRILTLATPAGPGTGSLFANPTSVGGSYEHGTEVILTANPASGSAIEAWSGACASTPITDTTCEITMDANKSAGVVFKTIEIFRNTSSFGGTLGTVNNGLCTWQISATVTSMTITLENRSTGAASTGDEDSNIGIVVTGGQPGVSCTASPFADGGSGSLTVNGSTITGTLSNETGRHTMTIDATRSGNTISGSALISQVTRDSNNNTYTTSKTFSFSLTRQTAP